MKGSVRKRGNKWSYIIDIGKVDGKRKQKEKGGFTTQREATQAMREAIKEYETTGSVFKDQNITVTEAIEYWYTTVAVHKLKYNSLRNYSQVTKLQINPAIGHLHLSVVKPETLEVFFGDILSTYSNSVLSTIRTVLSHTFKLMVKQSKMRYNPLLAVETKSKRSEKQTKTLSKSDIDYILSKLMGTRYYIPTMIALHTGMRLSESLGLVWSNIDFDTGVISVEKQLQRVNKNIIRTSLKTESSERKILMTDTLRKLLLTYKEQQNELKEYYGENYSKELDLVCCNEDGSLIPPDYVSTRITKISKKIGVKFTFHRFRHSYATILLENDVNAKVVQELLGHSDIRTTLNVYSHVTQKMESKAIKKLDAALK